MTPSTAGWHPTVDPLRSDVDWRALLAGPVPQRGVGYDATLQTYLDVVLTNGSRMTSPQSWGWITTGPTTLPTVVAAAGMVAAPQRQTMTAYHFLEDLSLDWLAQVCQLDPHMKGVYSSGGSTANLVALGAARQWALEQVGLDPADQVSTDVHSRSTPRRRPTTPCTDRRARLASVAAMSARFQSTSVCGWTSARCVQSMAVDRERGVLPLAVVAAAGTTNTGAIDPIREAGELAKEFGAWYHVDGAYGLPGILDERVTALYDGLELADSAIVDPHKWLGAPVGIAATFVRDRAILHRAFTQEPADYLEGAFASDDVQVSLDDMGVPYFDFGVELSAPSRGVQVWAILTELGVDGLRQRVVDDNNFARQVARRAHADPRLEVVAAPVLSICGFRYRTDAELDWNNINSEILRRLARETSIVVSSTVVRDEFVLRPCFINSRTTPADVDDFVNRVLEFGDEESA